ncbi:hypothetical protein ElyMa_005977000 [Elysia marginata]|uniref:MADF domain-containing protein n=1 Tax=Elysia marginata TaxID=1093978 RepID=A0AAV4GCT8_9GAST|nr:hypothetical protein ElyMa_005977000 [Elysia marginata]
MKFPHKTYEKLIDLVRERPALYNCQLTEYKDHQLQKNIWKNIAEEMGLEDMTDVSTSVGEPRSLPDHRRLGQAQKSRKKSQQTTVWRK